jgi:hypothetical protein
MNPLSIALRTTVLAGMVLAGLSIETNPASAQQRACVITDEGNTVCGKLTTQPKKSTTPSGYRKEVDKFVVLLKGCRRSDTTIKCNLSIANRDAEKSLRIKAWGSTIVDSTGKSYKGSTVDIGGRSSSDVSTTISPGIDYVADITFENIPEKIIQAPLLNLSLNTTADRTLQFRNVSFSD